MMDQIKLYEDKAFIKVEGPVIAGWHDCQFKELLALQDEKYDGQLKDQLIKWIGKPIPKDMMADVLALVKHYPRMEVQICLYYNAKDGQWLAHVPKQKGTPAHVSYSDEDYEPPKGFYFTGTIHTHPNMGAFWSSTDTNDQTKKTGLHVVLGLKEGILNSYLVSVFYNGVRYDQDQSIVEIPDINDLPEAKKEWIDAVEEVYEPEVVTKKEYTVPNTNWGSSFLKPHKDFLNNYRSAYVDDDYWGFDDEDLPYRSTNVGKNKILSDLFDILMKNFDEDDIYEAAAEMMETIGETAIADMIEEAHFDSKESNSKCTISM